MLKKIMWTLATLVLLLLIYLAPIKYWGDYYSDHLSHLPTEEKRVALTYDDGPSPTDTPVLLDILDRYQVKALFFLNGKHVEQHPELVREIHRRGHGIGNHSWSHQMLTQWATATPRQELESTSQIIEETIGERPRYFRPPYLITSRGLGKVVEEMNMQPVGISAGTNDWEEPSADVIAQVILNQVDTGGIIILHDGDAASNTETPQGSRAASVAATEIIITTLLAEGYRFADPEELLELGQR